MSDGVNAADIPFSREKGPIVKERIFRERGEQRYSLECLPAGITFEVERLRRSSQELWGELSVTLTNGSFPAAQTVDGVLSIGDMNFTSISARGARAKILTERSHVGQVDWFGLVEEFATKLINAERAGSPEMNLQMVPRPEPDRMFTIDGVDLPLKHPMILFGDGGTAKSYLAAYWGGRMMQQGHRVLYADWEFTPEEHRERLEYLFGPDFPPMRYLSCYRSFREEAERVKRAIRNNQTTFLICDSVGLACGGDPSSSESATTYFQALRSIGEIGSLHIAHVTKSTEPGQDLKPFGSGYWHNMARVTINVKSEELPDGKLAVALYPRKRNLKGRGYPSAYVIQFLETQTIFTRSDVKDHAVLSESLPVGERLIEALKFGSKTRKELTELLGVDYGLLQRAVHREIRKGRLVEFSGARKGQQRVALAGSAES